MIASRLPECWWVIHDDSLRYALQRVENGDITKEEAYARLIEHSNIVKTVVGAASEVARSPQLTYEQKVTAIERFDRLMFKDWPEWAELDPAYRIKDAQRPTETP